MSPQHVVLVTVLIVAFLIIATPIIVRADPSDWMKPTWHLENRTAEQIAADEQKKQGWLANYSKLLNELECLKNLKTEYVPDGACGTPTIEEQLATARQKTMEAAENPSPPCELKGFPGGIIVPDEDYAGEEGTISKGEHTRRCNTDENIFLSNITMPRAMETATTTMMKRTVDDGYTYPKNATAEEKAKIDAEERYLWEKAGRPQGTTG